MYTALIALNSFRNAEGLAPFADFRKNRHAFVLERFEDEYEVAAMNLIADLADENPDTTGEMIARSSNESFAEEGENLFNDAVADEQANAAIDDNNESEDSMDDVPDALLIDDETGETVRESEYVASQEEQAKIEAVEQISHMTKLPSYKQMVRDHGGTSKIENPVAFVHGFLDANPNMTRKQAVAALVSVHGVNYSTARTQFQKWFSKRNA